MQMRSLRATSESPGRDRSPARRSWRFSIQPGGDASYWGPGGRPSGTPAGLQVRHRPASCLRHRMCAAAVEAPLSSAAAAGVLRSRARHRAAHHDARAGAQHEGRNSGRRRQDTDSEARCRLQTPEKPRVSDSFSRFSIRVRRSKGGTDAADSRAPAVTVDSDRSHRDASLTRTGPGPTLVSDDRDGRSRSLSGLRCTSDAAKANRTMPGCLPSQAASDSDRPSSESDSDRWPAGRGPGRGGARSTGSSVRAGPKNRSLPRRRATRACVRACGGEGPRRDGGLIAFLRENTQHARIPLRG